MDSAAEAGVIRWSSVFGEQPALFLACFVVFTLTNLDQSLFAYAIPGILSEFGLPLQAAGLVLTISFLFAPIPIILCGLAADRYGRGTILWVMLALSSLCVGLQGTSGGIATLTIYRALGFGLSGSLSPITIAIVIEHATPRLRGVAVGILQCGYPVGWFIASMIVAPLLRHYSWRVACYSAFAVIPLAFVIARVVRSGKSRAPAPTKSIAPDASRTASFKRLFAPDLRARTVAAFLMFFAFGGAYAGSAFFFPTYFVQARHYTEADAAWIVGLSNGVAVIGYLSAALVGEFLLTRRNVFSLWCVGGSLALFGLLWVSKGMTQDILWYSLMAMFFFGSQAVVATFIGEVFPADIRTTALAVCGSTPLSLGFAVFPTVVPTVIAAMGWTLGLTLVVVPLLVGSGVIALLLPNQRSGLAAN